jgi:hypothetical protein
MQNIKGIENITWHSPCQIKDIDWDEIPYNPGLYIIRINKPIQRFRGKDPLGSLYIGKSKRLGDRVDQFWNSNHSASGFLWSHPKIASILLKQDIKDQNEISVHLANLTIKFSRRIPLRLLNYAEMALLFAYMLEFGEPPPLNSSIPGRWKKEPPNQTISWAKKAILE